MQRGVLHPILPRCTHAGCMLRCIGVATVAIAYSAVDHLTAQERERREAKARLDDDLAQASARVAAEKQKARLQSAAVLHLIRLKPRLNRRVSSQSTRCECAAERMRRECASAPPAWWRARSAARAVNSNSNRVWRTTAGDRRPQVRERTGRHAAGNSDGDCPCRRRAKGRRLRSGGSGGSASQAKRQGNKQTNKQTNQRRMTP